MPMDKVFVVGDSHAIALADGAAAMGMNVGMAYLSGNDWHSGVVRFHRRLGFAGTGRPGFQRKMREGCARLETDSVLQGDHALVTSLGFQLGRLLPPLMRAGHVIAGVSEAEGRHVISPGFVKATVLAQRAAQFDLVRKIARRRKIIVVSPPVLARSAEDDIFRDMIGEALKRAGADYFDTRSLLPDGGVMPDDERHEDGVHGNALYGERILSSVRDQFPAVSNA